MMMNLFSLFDPSTSTMSMNWTILIFLVLWMTPNNWKILNSMKKVVYILIITLKKELKFSLVKTEKGVEPFILTAFMILLLMNVVALFPYIFSLTSHLIITFPLSVMLWMSIVSFGWMNNTNMMLSHLVPQSTPVPLMAFMVLIETTSNLIRPVTLSIRMTANLVAGHLLMNLLGNALMKLSLSQVTLAMASSMVLTILETSVAFIQAYVFMSLITLYLSEIK